MSTRSSTEGAAADARWMQRALALARKGTALASPNPLVGSVVVKNGRVVGEGFHTYRGRQHAEVVALEAAGARARGATLYVNLEPCCTSGRTGPCTKAIIKAGVARVVAATRDPNPRVRGRGFRALRRAGIRVATGLREEEAKRQNEPFARWIRSGRPLVIQKIAMSLDGKMAGPPSANGRRLWISSRPSRAEVQELRHAADAVLTGIGTVLADDPRLTDRTARPRRRPLLRVVLDSGLRIPLDSRLVRTARGNVLVFTTSPTNAGKARALHRAGVEVVRVRARNGRPDLRAVLKELGRREILSVLLEAGPELNAAMSRARLIDRYIYYVAPQTLEGGVSGLPAGNLKYLQRGTLRLCGPDIVLEGNCRNVYGNR